MVTPLAGRGLMNEVWTVRSLRSVWLISTKRDSMLTIRAWPVEALTSSSIRSIWSGGVDNLEDARRREVAGIGPFRAELDAPLGELLLDVDDPPETATAAVSALVRRRAPAAGSAAGAAVVVVKKPGSTLNWRLTRVSVEAFSGTKKIADWSTLNFTWASCVT